MTQRVLVVGAGVAAYAAALRFTRQGITATVLVPARRQWPEFLETLGAGGFRALLQLGLTRSELAQSFPEVREHRSRWGDSRVHVRAHIPSLQSPVILGKSSLIRMLRAAALEGGAQILEIDRLVVAKETDIGVQVSFIKDGVTHELPCDYAIDASGRPATLGRQMGIRRVTLDSLVAFMIHGPARPAFAACVATVSIADGWTFWASDASGYASFAFFTVGRKLDGKMTPEQYSRFMERAQSIVARHGKTAIAWDEIIHGTMLPTTVVQYWRPDASLVPPPGTKLILSPANRVYLDMKYNDTAVLGLNWAGNVDVNVPYEWDPAKHVNVPESSILGVETAIWSETPATIRDLEFLLFPRLPAVAELGWTAQPARDWTDFRMRLGAQAPRWSALGINAFWSPKIDWTR